MRKTFVVGKLSREAAEIVMVERGSRAAAFRALRALVVKPRALRI